MNRTDVLTGPLAALTLSAAAAIVCCSLLGPTLGLAFAGFAFASIASPTYATVSRFCPLTWTLTQLALVLPIVIGWAWATTQDGWGGGALFWLTLLVVTYTAMLSVAAKTLSLAAPSSLASAIVTTAAIAWLAWPIWTAPWMTEAWAGRLISIHPLFAANAVTGTSPWPQHDVIYGMTRLGQDVAYAMPSTAWPAIALNVGVTVAMHAIARIAKHNTNDQPRRREGAKKAEY